MSSKAEKRRNKRTVIFAKGGRPRQQGPREANGRLDRTWQASEGEKSALRTGTEARQRLYGLPEAQCRLPEAGTVLGRLKLQQSISPDQYDAARRYQEMRTRYQRAIGAPLDYAEPAPDEEPSGVGFEDWARQTKDQHADMMDALRALCEEVRSPAPKAALDVIVHRDIDLPELHGSLRLALNALDRHFTGKKVREPEMAA